ncbi:ABC transporter permease [Luteibacter anthropi]|uniref:ABC transporter permease n=1 Tax=Luteibacter anthropi TaxID=564369 RepID=UPI002032D92A|nr:ABC transporter permease [Luteibacter anthropi]
MRTDLATYYLGLAFRRCVRNLPMVILLTGTMAVGIASCMTALTIFAALSGTPIPGVSEQLYVATMDTRTACSSDNANYTRPNSYFSLGDAKALVDIHRAPHQAAFSSTFPQVGTADGARSDQVAGLMAYGQAAELLQLGLVHGRAWSPQEERDRLPVVLIDTNLAQRMFGTDNAVGRDLRMGQRLFHVIGVYAPWKPRTKFMDLPHNDGQVLEQAQQVVVPLEAALDGGVGPLALGDCGDDSAKVTFQSTKVEGCRWLEVWAALPSATHVSSFRDTLLAFADTQHQAGRFRYPPQARLYGTSAWMAANHVVPDDVNLNAMLAGAFLLLCMVNVAGILAAYFLRRKADTIVRRALGATRRALFEQHMLEAGLLGVVGGLLALPLTYLGLHIVRMQPVAYAEAARMDLRAFVSLLLLSLVVGVVVGILPAWQACKLSPALQIKQA